MGKLNKPNVLRDVLIVGSPIILLGIIGSIIGVESILGGTVINIGYVMMMLFGAIILKRQSSSWSSLGLAFPNSWAKTLFLGVVAFVGALLLFIAVQIIFIAVISLFGMNPQEIDQSRFNPINNNTELYLLMLALAWTTIAFGEEMFFRAFLITRMLGNSSIKEWQAAVIAGILFGLIHFSEGAVGILSNASFGIFFGWIFVKTGRNLWIPIIAHGFLNTMRFTILYFGVQ
ncbi:CPBP family intramembrane metalloprotease [Alteromonas sp. ASW11-36]|uniref:CPBP family intramembrane metalloprotease n=1 Tax=Alteromonas arenosi TaxID=3055817 RepID=A0ABT7SVZ0_9ALTE|nr:CPBP family intramembrane glutamic endopeptidase [Alteromonas sp. ASW11-36]MDM7860362.1 CPBP family intramembrane metalloprotease [Alteromonas sp. ASW11-36]